MKYTLNTKKILKASIVLSSVVLFGCVQASDEQFGESYDNYQSESQTVDYRTTDEVVSFEAEGQKKNCIKSTSISSTNRSVAASTPAKPRVVPVKPADKCVVCKTAQTKKTEEKVTQEVAVRHKPQVAPTPEVEIETVAPALVIDEPAVTIAQEEPDFPVVENLIEAQPKEPEVKDEEEFVVIDETVVEDVVVDAQDEEAKKLAAEQEAERIRLQQEVERLEAEKKYLEEERVRITQVKRTTVESCEDVKDWIATEGTTLRSLLMEWGDRVGWRVVWNMDRDYTLEAGAVFRGRFVDVAAALIRSFARAVPAPKGVFYKGNKVLVVSTREDENAD